MDEQYTPTMDWLEAGWIKARLPDGIGAPGAHAEFTRAIAAHDQEVAEKAAKIADDFAREHEGYYGVAPQHAIQAANEIAERIRQSIEGEQR